MLLSSKSKRIACCWSTLFRNLCSKVAYALSYLKNAYPEMLFYKKALGKAFIHSFITEIYIAPLQGYYSEALPTLARLKRRVLRLE